MSEKITISEEEVKEIFKLWSEDHVKNPNNYDESECSHEEYGCRCSEHFFRLRKKLKLGTVEHY